MAGCYLATTDATTIKSVIAAIEQRSHGAKLLVGGDLNMELDGPEGNEWDNAITTVLSMTVLEDMSFHLLTLHNNHWSWDGSTCIMLWLV